MSGNLGSRIMPDSEIAGLSWRVAVDEDEFYYGGTPDGDCYTPRQVKAFRDGDWHYVSVSVTPIVAGVELDGLEDSLSGVEFGSFLMTDEDDNVTGTLEIGMDRIMASDEHYDSVVPDMISEAKTRMGGMAPVFAEVFGQIRGASEREPVTS